MEKIIKTSKIIVTVLKVFFWVIAAVSIVALAATAVVLIFGGGAVAIEGISITLGDYSVLLKGEYPLQRFAPLLGITLANVAVFGALSCYMIRTLRAIFEPMSHGRPFSTNVSGALKKLSYAVLIFGIMRIAMQTATNYLFFDAFDIPSLFAADKVASCSIAEVSDISFILWFILLRLISHVFKYGETLQQLSDETL